MTDRTVIIIDGSLQPVKTILLDDNATRNWVDHVFLVDRINMGLVIMTGMAFGMLFTLFVVPAIYTLLAREHSGGQKKAMT